MKRRTQLLGSWHPNSCRLCGGHGRADHRTISGRLKDGRRRTDVSKQYTLAFSHAIASELSHLLYEYDVQGDEEQRQSPTPHDYFEFSDIDLNSPAIAAWPHWPTVTCAGCKAEKAGRVGVSHDKDNFLKVV